MKLLSLGGFTVSATGQRNQLPVIENPSDREVCALLDLILSSRGLLSLWIGEEDEPGECSMNLFCDNGKSYVECSEITLDGNRVIYRVNDTEKPAQNATILGYLYSGQSVIDPKDVQRLFLLFLNTGGKVPPSFSVLN